MGCGSSSAAQTESITELPPPQVAPPPKIPSPPPPAAKQITPQPAEKKPSFDANDESTYPPPVPPRTKKKDIIKDGQFQEIDERAEKAPVEIRNSFDALIENLCPNNPPDIEKARVFFNWIAHQKLETVAWGKPEENTPLYLLWQLKNQYISYTTVYLELCRRVGLPCVIINGTSKSAQYEIGDVVVPDQLPGQWNAVFVDGDWRFVHVRWGTVALVGHNTGQWTLVEENGEMVSKQVQKSAGRLVFNLNEYWFFTDPENMIISHLPKDEKWQLLVDPFSLKAFDEVAYLRDQFFNLGLKAASHQKCRIVTINGEVELIFNVPKERMGNLEYSYKLYSTQGTKKALERFVSPEIRMDTCEYVVPLRFTVGGVYKLELNAVDRTKPGDYMKWICFYHITCPEPVNDREPFPVRPPNGYYGPGYQALLMGVKPLTHHRGIIESKEGEVEIKFSIEKKVEITQMMFSNSKHTKVLAAYVEQSTTSHEKVIKVRVPQKGEYALELFAQEENSSVKGVNICNYLVKCPEEVHHEPYKEIPEIFARTKEGKQIGVKADKNYPEKYIKTSDGKVVLKFGCPKGQELYAKLTMEGVDDEILKHYVTKTAISGQVIFDLRLPQNGDYHFDVFAEDKNSHNTQKVFEYHIQSAGDEIGIATGSQSLLPNITLDGSVGTTSIGKKMGVYVLHPNSGYIHTHGSLAEIFLQTDGVQDTKILFDHSLQFLGVKGSKMEIMSSDNVKYKEKGDSGVVLNVSLPKVGKYSLLLFARHETVQFYGHVCTFDIVRDDDKSKRPIEVTYYCTNVQNKHKIYLELKAKASGQDILQNATNRAPIRIVCVIDVSGSMLSPYGREAGISKLQKMKVFAQVLISYMHEQDFLGIVVFGDEAKTIFPLSQMTPENKEQAKELVTQIHTMGSTHLSAGLYEAIEQFRSFGINSFQEKIILFTDGGATHGETKPQPLIQEMTKRIKKVAEDCGLGKDYTISVAAFSTGGFMPELIYRIGQEFSSEAFYFLDEDAVLELNMMKTVVLQQMCVARNVYIRATCLNGVRFGDSETVSNENDEINVENLSDMDTLVHFAHIISADMSKNVAYPLALPVDNSTLKGKDILKIKVTYRDNFGLVEEVLTIPYKDLPRDISTTRDVALVKSVQEESRLHAYMAVIGSSRMIARGDNPKAKDRLLNGKQQIEQTYLQVESSISKSSIIRVTQYKQSLTKYLDFCNVMIDDENKSKYDTWGNFVSYAASFENEAPTTNDSIGQEDQLFRPKAIAEVLEEIHVEIVDQKAAMYKDYYEELKKAIASGDPKKIAEAIKNAEDNNVPDNGLIEDAKEEIEYLKLKAELVKGMKALDDSDKKSGKKLEKAIKKARSLKVERQNRFGELLENAESAWRRWKRYLTLRITALDLKQATITELRKYSQPTEEIHQVLLATFVLLGKESEQLEYWQGIQRYLGTNTKPRFLTQVQQLEPEHITKERAKRTLEMLEDFTEMAVCEKSAGAGTFYKWIKQMITVWLCQHVDHSDNGDQGDSDETYERFLKYDCPTLLLEVIKTGNGQ